MPRWNYSELPKQKTLLCFFKFFAPHFFPRKSGKEKFLFRTAERSGADRRGRLPSFQNKKF